MANEFLNFILALVIIIVAAKGSGYISTRLGQPSVLGELLAGVILGPTVLDIFHAWPVLSGDEHLPEFIHLLAELGVVLLMALAGLELHVEELLRSGKVSAYAGVLGVVIPFFTGWGIATLFGASSSGAVFIGLTLAATSVSISAQTLLELGQLRSRVGLALLGAAVFDDILVILFLSLSLLLVGEEATGGLSTVVFTLLRMLGYFVVATLIGLSVIPRLLNWVSRLPISQGTVTFVLVLILLYAWAAEALGGLAAITGAFMAGLFLARTSVRDYLIDNFATLAYGFFVPIFFVNIGLQANLRAIDSSAWGLGIILLITAVLGKILGSGFGARVGGFTNRESLQLGIGMVSRGEVGLIVASFALIEGLISSNNFSILVFIVIIATLITPPMLRASFATQTVPATTKAEQLTES